MNRIKRSIKVGFKKIWDEHSYFFALVVLVVLASIFSDRFLTLGNMMNVMRRVSIIGIVSVGMTLVIIGGKFDLSVGAVLALVGGVILTLTSYGLPVYLSILAGLLLGAFIGFINGYIINKFNLASFIVTLATMAIARSLVIYAADGSSIIGSMRGSFVNIGNGNIAGIIPNPVIIFLVVAIIFHFILSKSKFGKYVYAIGDNEKAAKYSGINVRKISILTFVLIGVCVAIAATVEASRLASISSSSSGSGYELEAIASVIIGGTPLSGGKGHIIGTVVGVVLLGLITNFMNLMNVSPYLTGTVRGLIILGAVLIQKKQ